MSKTKRNAALVEDDRWKMKGGPHFKHNQEPEVCSDCSGLGWVKGTVPRINCPKCDGTGEVWK